MEEIAALAARLDLEGLTLTATLVLARVIPVVSLAPFLGGQALSRTLRVVVSLALLLALWPAAAAGAPRSPAPALFLALLLKEATVGVALGLLSAVAFETLRMAGQLVDQARSGVAARLPSPLGGERQGPLASLYLMVGVALFLVLGGHRAFLAALAGSYQVVPLESFPLAPAGLAELALLSARLAGAALAAAVLLAAPALAALTLTDLALGLLGRAAPQLGSTFLAMPLRAAVGLALSLLALSAATHELAPLLGRLTELAAGALAHLRPSP